jgi:hypothetical protein
MGRHDFVIDIYTFDGLHLQQLTGDGDYYNNRSFHIILNGIMM